MSKTIFFIFLTSYFLLLTSVPVFAQSTSSVTVKVGNPPENTGLAKAADDLFNAYKVCSGNTDPKARFFPSTESSSPYTLKPCLIAQLKDTYSSTINAFIARYGSKLGDGANPSGCVECLPYVALAMSLASGKTDTLTVYNSPKDYYSLPQISSKDLVFDSVIPSASNPPRPGDIGMSITAGEVSNVNVGHAVIVESFDKDSPDTFIGNESSWQHCFVSNIQGHKIGFYHFFRLRT